MLRDPALIPLSHQHHNGLALCVLVRRSLKTDTSPENLTKLAGRIADRYDLELTNHFMMEEQVLFPGVRPWLAAPQEIDELVLEHQSIAALVGELRLNPSVSRLHDFCDLLTAHIRREENELFQAIQASVPQELLSRLGAQIDSLAVRICL